MNEIDQATQRNAAASEEVASSSDEMNSQASTLQDLVGSLNGIVEGAGSEGKSRPRPTSGGDHRGSSKPAAKPIHLASRSAKGAGKGGKKGSADHVIPFDDDEPKGKIGTAAGF